MSVTIKDVAKMANVSTMTVSRVVNNLGQISPTTKERVENAIKTLRYRPNTIARTLVAQKSRIISLIVPDIANPFFSETIKVAELELRKYGYSLYISDAGWDVDNERNFINSSIGQMVDGVIMFTPRLTNDELMSFSESIPLVVVDRSMEGTSVQDVYIDNYQGAFNATEYLIRNGHKRIGYIRGWEDVLNTKRREQGYIDAHLKYGIEYDEKLTQIGDYREVSGYEAYNYFMGLTDPPTAVFASNDLMAYGFISACMQDGKSIPNDISVMGFDDINLFFAPITTLSTVRLPRDKMILKAIHILLGLPAEDISKFDKDLHTELIIKGSVKEI